MQAGGTEQGSKLKKVKTVSYWMLGTIAAVPLTKMAESYFDVSFFSSTFAAAWLWAATWLNQTFLVQLWLLLSVAAVLALLSGIAVWSVLDKRLEVSVTKAEQEKAYAKAREAIGKLNSVDAALNATRSELQVVRNELEATELERTKAIARIVELQTPKVQPLNEQQRIVLAGIAHYDNSDENCSIKSLGQKIKFSLVQTDGAVDVLVKRKLVEEYYNSYGSRIVSLSPEGRAYVLQPDFDISFIP